jgi:hypothetical protein
MYTKYLGLAMTLWAGTLFCKSDIQVIPVERTPEPDQVEVRIAFPLQGMVIPKNETPPLQVRLEAYPLGLYSDFLRAHELRDPNYGQSLLVIVDDHDPIFSNLGIEDVSDTLEEDFDQTINVELPFKLEPGVHVVRSFPTRSFDESLKNSKCFEATYFFKGEKKGSVDLSKPYLTYNQPRGNFEMGMPILLDFYVTNVHLSEDGYKVRVSIDGNVERILTAWVPYYIRGLKKGSHTISLELLTASGKVLPPLFKGELTHRIEVK